MDRSARSYHSRHRTLCKQEHARLVSRFVGWLLGCLPKRVATGALTGPTTCLQAQLIFTLLRVFFLSLLEALAERLKHVKTLFEFECGRLFAKEIGELDACRFQLDVYGVLESLDIFVGAFQELVHLLEEDIFRFALVLLVDLHFQFLHLVSELRDFGFQVLH